MWKILVSGCLISQILIFGVAARAVETMDSISVEQTPEPIEIPIKIGPRKSSTDNFSILKQLDDPIFNFMNRMVNVSYLSSQLAVNRIRDHTDKVKEIGGQVEEFIESLPTFPIPVVDDLSHRRLLKPNHNISIVTVQ